MNLYINQTQLQERNLRNRMGALIDKSIIVLCFYITSRDGTSTGIEDAIGTIHFALPLLRVIRIGQVAINGRVEQWQSSREFYAV